MTAQEFAYAGLEYIGEPSMTLTGGYTQASVYRALRRALNQAQQELFELNPALFRREIGVAVPAPQTGTVTVTSGDTAVSATAGFTNDPTGNTILIAGQSEYNAIYYEAAQKFLLFPYTGSSGTKTATRYGDSIDLSALSSRPLGPVWLSDIRELIPLASRAELLAFDTGQAFNTDWGRRPTGTNRLPQARTVGQPEAFLCEPTTFQSGASSQVRLILTPLPDRAYSLRYIAAVRPVDVTTANFGTEGSDSSPRTFPLPGNLDALFLLPLFLYHWSRSAFFKDEDAKRQIVADYAAALPKIAGYRVQPQTGGHMVSAGWRRYA